MKKLIFALVATVALALGAEAQVKDSLTYTKNGMAVGKIKTSAVCDMCKETLEKAMAYEKGVKESSLDVDSKIITVTFDPKKTSLSKIREAIVKTGYDADGIPANQKAYDNLDACCKKDYKH
ncbi:MAG: heavy-metal-associated domain-containing protein [Bacteroidota bacterium]